MPSETVYLKKVHLGYLDDMVDTFDAIDNRSQAIQYVIREYKQLQEADNHE